jgi:plasmid stability protein
VRSAFDDWVASLGGSVSAEAREFLRRVFDEHGPVSSEEARRIGHHHQLAFAQEAVALVARDISMTTNADPPRSSTAMRVAASGWPSWASTR